MIITSSLKQNVRDEDVKKSGRKILFKGKSVYKHAVELRAFLFLVFDDQFAIGDYQLLYMHT